MIKSFRHKGIKLFFESGSTRGIQDSHAQKLRMQLAALETARCIDDLNIPGYRLHPLKGNRRHYWSISVSGSWRLTFRFQDQNVLELDYEDYH